MGESLHIASLPPCTDPPTRPRHCADAVLSLSNRITVVGDVASPLVEFITKWIQTPSGYDVLFARTIPTHWARAHKLVLSRRIDGKPYHELYTAFDVTEPNRELARCHQGCGIESRVSAARGSRIEISCLKCGSSSLITKVKEDTSTVIGAASLVKTPYLPGRAPIQWRYPDDTSALAALPLPLSKSISLPTDLRIQTNPPMEVDPPMPIDLPIQIDPPARVNPPARISHPVQVIPSIRAHRPTHTLPALSTPAPTSSPMLVPTPISRPVPVIPAI